MNSFRVRITLFVIGVVLVSVGTVSLTSLIAIRNTAEKASVQFVSLLCDSKYREMNEYMDSVRQSVDILSHYLSDDLDAVALLEGGVVGAKGTGELLEGRDWESQQQQELDAYLHSQVQAAQVVFKSVAFNTNNAISYYYRLNPELSSTERGFLYSKNGTTDYYEMTPTDILAFDKNDAGRVGWYYKTIDRGRPSWLEPYYDENIRMKMTSYIAPIYKAGTFVGIVGMDISYDTLVEQIKDLDIYETGYAFLTDGSGAIVYHPYLEEGTLLSDVNRELSQVEQDLLQTSGNSSSLINYTYNGIEKRAASQILENGLRLVMCAPEQEINAEWQALVRRVVIITLGLLALFVSLVTLIMRHITRPLQRLTVAANQISAGNYDVDLPENGTDEIGSLTGAFRELVDHLRIYIDDLNSKAYKDPLTHVKNKAAFDIWVRQINEELHSEDEMVHKQFAILMFDCNLLKEINDRYGHTRGDLYLQKGSSLICSTFAHSPVFRVGGDEFVVVLENEEYRDRKKLMEQFRKSAEENNAHAAHPWDKISMAMGIGVFNPRSDHSIESVYKRADKAMYANKRDWKEANENK